MSAAQHGLAGCTVLADSVQRMQSQNRHQAISCTVSMLKPAALLHFDDDCSAPLWLNSPASALELENAVSS